MNKWLNKYFDLSKGEFNGLMVLMALMMFIIIFPHVYAHVFPYADEDDTENMVVEKLIVEDLKGDEGQAKAKKIKNMLFAFDPNTLDLFGWQQLGFSASQAKSILKYRSKGGRFYKKEDLKKMYVVSAQMYLRLSPYIKVVSLKEQIHQNKSYVDHKAINAQKTLKIIELNHADTASLVEVHGIGPAFARRIIQYRTRLGGFYRKEQLLEVFGLDSLKYEEVKAQLSVDESLVKKININTASVEDFKNHPYIRYKQVNALIQYKKQHGNYSNIEDLKKVAILTPELIGRLAPYLSFEL